MTEYTAELTSGGAAVGDAAVIADLALAAAEPTTLEPGSKYAFVVPIGHGIEVVDNDLETDRLWPLRKAGTVTVYVAHRQVLQIARRLDVATPTLDNVAALLRLKGQVSNLYDPAHAARVLAGRG